MKWFVSIPVVASMAVAQSSEGSGASAERSTVRKLQGVLKREFVFTAAPFARCHASTIAISTHGPVSAWFAGTRESHPDVGIWLSRRLEAGWTKPVRVATGFQYRTKKLKLSYPCWNPVLFQPKDGNLQLFYKCGPSPSEWWGMHMSSPDAGATWSVPVRLPEGILGPIKNKPLQLEDGSWLCGSSTEDSRNGWNIHLERTADRGRTWERIGPVEHDRRLSCIQPTLLRRKNGDLQLLCRTKNDVIAASWSKDGGATWSKLEETLLPNPNSGIDALVLANGRAVLAYNHSYQERFGRGVNGRDRLHLAVQRDGADWLAALELENEAGSEFSYPSLVQDKNGFLHLTYTYKRTRIRYLLIDPTKINLRAMIDGAWPKEH